MSSLSSFSESSGSISSSESIESIGMGGSISGSEDQLVKEDQSSMVEDLASKIAEVDLPLRTGIWGEFPCDSPIFEV